MHGLTATSTEDVATRGRSRVLPIAFATLGVVYGDIGTSPLYAMKACFAEGALAPTETNVLGIVSLVFWSLTLLVSVKLIAFLMQADNRGEGGVLALMALATGGGPAGVAGAVGSRRRKVLAFLGIFGAALVYADGMITPPISVLGAVEGLGHAAPRLEPYVVPVTVGVLLVLFMMQQRGTHGIAKLFSPVMAIWFASISLIGAVSIAKTPSILRAIDPRCALAAFEGQGLHVFAMLGLVFLAVTGVEALYADMGHFGKRPIRFAWFSVVFPSLMLNYLGQGALLLREPSATANPFYDLLPSSLVMPMVVLATMAASVASQALISGAFSLTRQAMQLGYMPRLMIRHTSKSTEGQIYIPAVNWLLMVACIAVVLHFGSADALGAAYGIAVAGTLIIDSALFFVVAQDRLGYSRAVIIPLVLCFLVPDFAFFGANVAKILAGGWIIIAVAMGILVVMLTWRAGRNAVEAVLKSYGFPIDLLIEDLKSRKLPTVKGNAVFMTGDPERAPLVLLHHLKHNKCLHERIVLLSLVTEPVPTVADAERVEVKDRGGDVYQVFAHFGFMETPNARTVMERTDRLKAMFKPEETTYYLGRQTLIPTGPSHVARWRKQLFLFLSRNERSATMFFGLPPNRVVELGAQVQF